MSDYLEINRANWDSRVPHHLLAYGVDAFLEDPTHLSEVVAFDQPRLGDITGLDVVHLQCHIGTDTMSLARLGARRVVGLDFSSAAVAAARELAVAAQTPVTYVESDVYDAPAALGGETFDLVYTGIGAISWLPDIRRWAHVVAAVMRPGGRLFMREGHPMLGTISDPREDGLLVVEYPYFEDEGTTFVSDKSYVEHEGVLASPEAINFNHGLGEIVSALLDEGLRLTRLEEHDSAPWNPVGPLAHDVGGGEFALREGRNRLAMTFTIEVVKDRDADESR